MPITPPPRKVTETENMLRLLLSVDALESVTAAQLWSFAAELDMMDYVTMRLCLHKLLAAGELDAGEGALAEQLYLTDRGREALTLFGERVPGHVKEQVCAAAPAFRQRLERERQVHAAYEIARPGEYRLNLSVQEGDLPTIRLKMETGNRTLASKAIHRFPHHAAEVTTYLYGLAEQAFAQPEAGQAQPPEGVTEHSAGEFTACVRLTGDKASFDVCLLLPNRRAAEGFIQALQRPDGARQTAQRLTAIITASVRKAGKPTER